MQSPKYAARLTIRTWTSWHRWTVLCVPRSMESLLARFGGVGGCDPDLVEPPWPFRGLERLLDGPPKPGHPHQLAQWDGCGW